MSGLEPRYDVKKRSDPAGKHSIPATLAYAESCKEDEPELSNELSNWARWWGNLHA